MTPSTLSRGIGASLTEFDQLPVVDVGPYVDGSDKRGVADRIGIACRDVGFFYIRNHGVAGPLVEKVFKAAEEFFLLPVAEKRRIDVLNSPAYRGYVPLYAESVSGLIPNLRECFDIGNEFGPDYPHADEDLPLHGRNQWPARPAGLRPALEAYWSEMMRLANQLMGAMALSLGLDESYFDQSINWPLAQIRLNHYPPQTKHLDGSEMGIDEHSDYGCLTILAQDDVGGLEVKNAAGTWIHAPPIPGTFIINLGQQMQRWTNDLFKATMHRAVNASGRERYSIPFFFDANWDARIECLPTCRSAANPAKYPPVMAGPALHEIFLSAYFNPATQEKAGAPARPDSANAARSTSAGAR